MKADIVIKGNAIFDAVADKPFKGYVAIKGNKIVSAGEGNVPEQYMDAKIIEAGERTVMPGIHDSHSHLLMAGMYQSYVNLLEATTEEEAARMVYDARETSRNGDWIVGFSWYHVFWDNKTLPGKESLDKYFPDNPVFLLNAEAHGGWINSKAMEIAGIDKDTPDPFGGEIARDENGEPTGFLYEGAARLATKYALTFSPEDEKKLIKTYMESAAKYGITSVNDVMPYFHGDMGSLAVYSDMDRAGDFTVRVHAATDLLGDLDKAAENIEKYSSDSLKCDMVKQFLDGVTTTHTALVLDDYTDAPGNKGVSLFDTEAIGKAVPEAHKRGLSVKLHSCGDASARMALDNYEEAIKLYGKNHCRHAIEHCEMISDEDMPRFGEMGVIPSVQPEHLALTQTFEANPYRVTLGEERAAKAWPFKDLLDSAGVLAFGSDCPVVDNNPFLEIYRAVTRVHNDGEPKGGWNPAQKLSLSDALKSYTIGSAYGVRREKELGTLEAGKFADIVILDTDLFDIPESDLIDRQVDMTIMDGKVVYTRD